MTVDEMLAALSGFHPRIAEQIQSSFQQAISSADPSQLHECFAATWNERDKVEASNVNLKNFRGRIFHEFCRSALQALAMKCGLDAGRVIEEAQVVRGQFVVPSESGILRMSRRKRIDLVIGRSEGNDPHPYLIASCKLWHDAPGLAEDVSVFTDVRSIYPLTLACSLSMYKNVAEKHRLAAYVKGCEHFVFFDDGNIDGYSAFLDHVSEALPRHLAWATRIRQSRHRGGGSEHPLTPEPDDF